ncbi:MAG: hypothetical protein KGI33_06895 [Thaumarchaeota archaeon]|nr:hypothetical protein [Nitrososphaerota archaeon]
MSAIDELPLFFHAVKPDFFKITYYAAASILQDGKTTLLPSRPPRRPVLTGDPKNAIPAIRHQGAPPDRLEHTWCPPLAVLPEWNS